MKVWYAYILVEGMPVQIYGETHFSGFASAYYIWLDAEWREEFNISGIIFIA